MAREISPSSISDAATYYSGLSRPFQHVVDQIRASKEGGQRRRPSSRAIFVQPGPTPDWRPALLDKVAALVDENVFGRSEMCLQFAALLRSGLYLLGIKAS